MTFTTSSDEFKGLIGPVALELFGEPTFKTATEWRYGNKGSLCIDLEKDVWKSFEDDAGGGVVALVVYGEAADTNADAYGWLEARGAVKGNGKAFKGANRSAFPPRSEILIAQYEYTDEFGTPTIAVWRFEPRQFRRYRWDGEQWVAGGTSGLLTHPYKLINMLWFPNAPIYLCEGEKDVDRLTKLGLIATTNISGALNWNPEINKWFEGRNIVILVDNDDTGRKRTGVIVRQLSGIASSMKSVELPGLPEKGDVSDWLDQNGDDKGLLLKTIDEVGKGVIEIVAPNKGRIQTVDFYTLLTEVVEEEPDYIEPDFAGPGGFVLIAGPPKAQKSFLLQEILVAAATGTGFLMTFTTPRPLKVFCLQAEMNRKLLRKRAREMSFLPLDQKELLKTNLIFSERFHMIMDDAGVRTAVETIKEAYPDEPPDIIAFDPLANLFEGESENDNAQVMKFLTQRLEAIRQIVNPLACIVLVHHSTKKSNEDMARDPFIAIRGAGALRGYYDSCIVIFRKAEEGATRRIHFELRGGESPEPIDAQLVNGKFQIATKGDGLPSRETCRLILKAIDVAWKRKTPWSPNAQASVEGRYAIANIMRQFEVSREQAENVIQGFQRDGVAIVRQRKQGPLGYPAGLEVVGTLD